jgi:multidrug/hemolysin transport system ATP-binding protein
VGAIIEIQNLVKRYGALTAVDGISLSVEEGSLFAFLGPNGAGKTTTINVMCTTLPGDGGTISINGFPVGREDDEVRRSIGVVFQHSVLDNLLTVRENLKVRASFYGVRGAELGRRTAFLADAIGLGDFLDRRYGNLSGGQRRRADVARALIHTPKILFLDEPTTGLDPQTRQKVWRSISDMQRKEKMTVFLTTHYMEEAAGADDVAIIDHGRIVAQGTPASLKERYSTDSLIVVPTDGSGWEAALADAGLAGRRKNDTVVIAVRDSLHALSVLKRIEPFVASFEVIKGNMDAVFMTVTGHAIRGEEEE